MRRMYSKKQIEGMSNSEIQKYVESGVLQSMFVNKISAPESTTLTDDLVSSIIKGVFVEGQFLDFINPIFFPAKEFDTTYSGVCIGTSLSSSVFYIQPYEINKSTKVITKTNVRIIINKASNQVQFPDSLAIKGKVLPTNPSDTGSFTLKMVDGVLTWVADE